jgi:hypothetical protein
MHRMILTEEKTHVLWGLYRRPTVLHVNRGFVGQSEQTLEKLGVQVYLVF